MIEGVLRHCTEMSVERNYVDSHGQSEVAFAFSQLLGLPAAAAAEGDRAAEAVPARRRRPRGLPAPRSRCSPGRSTGSSSGSSTTR